jgi:hypothetical protein
VGGLEAGQSDVVHLDEKSEVLQRPYGAQSHLFTAFPTLKRGASHHCAYGAIKIGTSPVSNLDSCDCPGLCPESRVLRIGREVQPQIPCD